MNEHNPLEGWRRGVVITKLLGEIEAHTMHTYFNTSPESPDGRWVLFFQSVDPKGHVGDVVIRARAGGETRVLARGVTTEDAHRAALQQWASGGRRVVYHDLRDGEWIVAAVDIETGKEQVYAPGRQVGFGRPDGDVVPLYGPHWAPGEHRNLELLDLTNGKIRTALTHERVRAAFPEWVERRFGARPISVFFPLLAPGLGRVMFKVATPGSGRFQTKGDSERDGLLCYDLEQERFLWMHEGWGHPAWSPDGRRLINLGPVLVNVETGKTTALDKFPRFRGSHPSFSPDGELLTTENKLGREPDADYTVVVGHLASGEFVPVHRFDNTKGADSWRRSHPHPVFSPDGRRLYFNVSEDRWTRLYVAERA